MRKILYISSIIVLILCLCSCSKAVKDVTNDTIVSVTETTTLSTTKLTTEQVTTKTITQQNITTTKKQTTTTATTTKKVTTTQKPTTTKSATTKRETTTEPYCCYEGGSHHTTYVGQIGWHSSYDEALAAVVKYCNEHPELKHYTIKKCSCGLYTATLK